MHRTSVVVSIGAAISCQLLVVATNKHHMSEVINVEAERSQVWVQGFPTEGWKDLVLLRA